MWAPSIYHTVQDKVLQSLSSPSRSAPQALTQGAGLGPGVGGLVMRGVMAFQRRLPWRHDAELARAGS
jgi:hypothetical protein